VPDAPGMVSMGLTKRAIIAIIAVAVAVVTLPIA
jgi:hypothetical protein